MSFQALGMVARWKPVHLGHSRILRALGDQCERLHVGIGSCNRYDRDNPFTARETEDMVRLIVPRATVHPLEDLGDGPRWGKMVADRFGPLDLFVTANGYVRQCLLPYYQVCHPLDFLTPEEQVAVDGTMVREAIRSGGDWRSLMEPAVADYLQSRGLSERLRQEFPE